MIKQYHFRIPNRDLLLHSVRGGLGPVTQSEADMRMMTEPGDDTQSDHQPVIAAFGNPLLDIIVSDEVGEMVQRFGLEADIAQEVDTLELGLLDMVREKEDIQYSGGGCALNTTRVYQWLSGELGLGVVSNKSSC